MVIIKLQKKIKEYIIYKVKLEINTGYNKKKGDWLKDNQENLNGSK